MGTQLDLSDLPKGVQYLSRESWGLNDDEALRRGLAPQPDGLPEVYYHHTAGSTPDLSRQVWDDDPVRYIQWLDNYERETNGYKATVYSWLIHTAPRNRVTIVEARGDFYPGATRSRNQVSKAFCWAGNFDSRYPPRPARSPRQRELDAGRWLRHALVRAGVLTPDVEGRGHLHNPSCPGCTACPGNLFVPHIGYINTPLPTPEPAPEPPPVDPDPTPTPTGALHTMYELRYRKPGWPAHARFRVTATQVIHITNGDAADVDANVVPVHEASKKDEMLAVLADERRTHVGANPFEGDYGDAALNAAW